MARFSNSTHFGVEAKNLKKVRHVPEGVTCISRHVVSRVQEVARLQKCLARCGIQQALQRSEGPQNRACVISF